MRLNVRSLKPGLNKRRLSLPAETVPGDWFTLACDGEGVLEADYRESTVYIKADISATVISECARCLNKFEYPVHLATVFVAKAGYPDPSDEEDENILYFHPPDEVIDLTNAVLEEIAVSLPMMPLCRETCRGLCPKCGANRNERDCHCRFEGDGSPWEALAKLKRR